MHILDLPNVILVEIFEFLSYEEVSKKRLVCRQFDQIAQEVLNGGFNKAIKRHSDISKHIKTLLPRRESERRIHCLARHSDILTSLETRISMLTMTYSKYIDLNLCCFIPGRVLDEIFRILRLISKTNRPVRPHEILQELRDISSMAIEHFDERIANNLKKKFANTSKVCNSSGHSTDTRFLAAASGLGITFRGMESSTPTFSSATVALFGNNIHIPDHIKQGIKITGDRPTINPYKQLNDGVYKPFTLPSTSAGVLQHPTPIVGCKEARSTMIYIKKLEAEHKKGIEKMNSMEQVQNLQDKKLQQSMSAVAELSVQIVELKKRLEDVDAKNRELSANIKRINDGEATTSCTSSNSTIKTERSNNDERNSSSPSSSTVNTAINSCKRRKNATTKTLNSDLQVKKPKL